MRKTKSVEELEGYKIAERWKREAWKEAEKRLKEIERSIARK